MHYGSLPLGGNLAAVPFHSRHRSLAWSLARRGPGRTWFKANSRIHALPSPAMTTPSGWEPRPGPTRGDQARRVPRGTGGRPPDEADPRRQVPRGTGPVAGRGWDAGPGDGQGHDGQGRGAGDGSGPAPRSAPGRAPGPRDGGQAGQRPPRDGQGRRFPGANGYDRRGLPDDFAGRPRPSGEIPASDRGRPGGPPDGLDALRSGALLRWLGTMSTRTAVLVLAGAALAGALLTVITAKEPGNLLGAFVIVGSLAAVLGVRRGAVYLFFPLPALAAFVAAVAAGVVHDRHLASSAAGLAATFPQWVAGIFWPAVLATILVLLVGSARWLLKSPLVMGQSPLSAPRPAKPDSARRDPGFRPPADSWARDSFDGGPPRPRTGSGPTPRQGTGPSPQQGTGPTQRQQTGPGPRQGTGPTQRQGTGPTPQQGGGPRRGSANGSRPGRGQRDPRTDRDPWGDPRLPPDRSQPTGPRPQAPRGPASEPQPRAPRQGQTGPGPSFNPAPAPPPRRQPPDGWTQR